MKRQLPKIIAAGILAGLVTAAVPLAQQKGKSKFNTWRQYPRRLRFVAVLVARSDQ